MDVTTTVGDVTVLSVSGDIDARTFPELIAQADQVLNQGHKNLVLDLRNVNYVSSGGLVAFQTIAGRAANQGGKAVFTGLHKRVFEVFTISGFNEILSVYPNLTAAKASFEQK